MKTIYLIILISLSAANLLLSVDTWKPIPTYKLVCDGNGLKVQNGSVEDKIYNNDSTTRSNLRDVYLIQNQSYNVDFILLNTLEPGLTSKVNWSLTKTDLQKDAKAVLIFKDKAGNDTSITIELFYTNLDLSKDENYGRFKLNQAPVTKTFTIKNNSNKMVRLNSLSLWKMTEGYKINPLQWSINQPFQIGESRTFSVDFTPDNNLPNGKKLFIDSLGIGDSCSFKNFVEIRASLGAPLIDAEDRDFGIFNIASPTPFTKTLRVYNPSIEADLTITGTNSFVNPAIKVSFNLPTIKSLSDITIYNPLVIKAGLYAEILVEFKPIKTGIVLDSIVFFADAQQPDNITKIKGVGVGASILINDYDWGDHEVTTAQFPIIPKLGVNATDTTLTFYNNGDGEIEIDDISIKTIKGDANSFLLDDVITPITSFKVLNPSLRIAAGKKVIKKIYFSPIKLGEQEIEVTFLNSANILLSVKLKGNGVKSAASIQENYDDKISISNKENSIFISSKTDEKLKYKLISLTGTQISNGNLETTTEILLNNLPKQILLLEILNSLEQVVLRKKVMME